MPSWSILRLALWFCLGLAAATALAPAAMAQSTKPAAAPAVGPAPALPHTKLDAAIASSAKFLLGQIGDDGKCTQEYPSTNVRFGGVTALTVYALLTADVDHKDPAVKLAIDWLQKQKLTGTYAVSMRACALSAYYLAAGAANAAIAKAIKQDMDWLIDAADKSGAYTYTAIGSKEGTPKPVATDNSNAQMAVMAVQQAAQTLGVDVPEAYWKRVERYWLDQQQIDGGFGYLIPPGEARTKSYGTMTAAGLATLLICHDAVNKDNIIKCKVTPESKQIADAYKWLAAKFTISDNPGKGSEWYYYWLFSLERVGLFSGQKYIGGHDWYAEGVAELLDRRSASGSFGAGDDTVETAFGLIFLARGRQPVLLSKLDYGGKWNPRPRDAANFARWVSYSFERHVSWQAVRLDDPEAEIGDAPILYISGAGPCELTPVQVDKLRTFVLRGGTIISESAGNNADFTLDMQKLNKKLWPQFPAARVPAGHALYTLNFKPGFDAGLTYVTNGVRILAIHSPSELSMALQVGPTSSFKGAYELLANMCLYVTDRGVLRPRGSAVWPKAAPFTPMATIAVARLKHSANCDPEPLAWQRLAIMAGNSLGIKLDVTEPMDITKLDAAKWPAAHMTGTGELKLTADESAAMKKYLAGGGTLIVDSAGGDKTFSASVEKDILPLAEGTAGLIASDNPVLKGPMPVKIAYRRDYATALGNGAKEHRLRGVEVVAAATGTDHAAASRSAESQPSSQPAEERASQPATQAASQPSASPATDPTKATRRLAIYFSPDDLTAGLAACHAYGINGYTPQCATTLMLNMLADIVQVKANPPK